MRMLINYDRIHRNALAVNVMCSLRGINVVGVVKACCGNPEVAHAVVAGGIRVLGESRLQNIVRLRNAGIAADFMLLRSPRISEAMDTVRHAQISLNSEPAVLRALSQAASAAGVRHQVILMVELGDRREGIMPEDVAAASKEITALPALELAGIGVNWACVGGVLPSVEKLELFTDIAKEIERVLGQPLPVVSGGNTANLDLLLQGKTPDGINQLRIGEAILLGTNVPPNNPLPGLLQDTFEVMAEVIEVRTKPSLPDGVVYQDAFGRHPHWVDRGLRRRAIVAMGEQDLRVSGLAAKRPGVTIVGASSDHMVLDVSDADPPVYVGEELAFRPGYSAVATAMVNPDLIRTFEDHPFGHYRRILDPSAVATP